MHVPYQDRLKHPPDFRVSYRFFSVEEGGRKTIPFQGIRCDFWYEHPNHIPMGMFMIWPEFEDDKGEIILDNTISVPAVGYARMWIINPERRPYHQVRIAVGMKGYFMEGSRRTAECDVVEIVGLKTNSDIR